MADCVIIADDLTGANATGALLQKIHYSAYTVMNMERLSLSRLKECNCIVYPTDSRGIEKRLAYNRVYNVSKLLQNEEVKIFSKRIDSTLRGNVGSETDALLDSFDGEKKMAVAVPCFPESGRIVCGGYMLVNGVPLHKTSAAIDPKTPVLTSEVVEIFRGQSKYPVASLSIGDLKKGKDHLIASLRHLREKGVRIVVFDSTSQEDIDLIADAVVESKLQPVLVDPGPFTMTVVRISIKPRTGQTKKKILAVIGSVNPVTKMQVEKFLLSQEPFHIFVNTKRFVESEEERKTEIERVVREVLTHMEAFECSCVIGDGIEPENRIDFSKYYTDEITNSDELCKKINRSFAEITKKIVDAAPEFGAIYSSEGDITVAICQRFEASGIKLLGEVLPLAAYGEVLGGDYEGMKMVTKGGMAGNADALRDCINYLKDKI